MILDSKLIYSGILRPVKEKEKLKKEKEERLTEIEQSQISPRKKNILNNVIDTVYEVKAIKKRFSKDQQDILERGEDIIKKWMLYEEELYEEELFEVGRKHSRTKRQLPKSNSGSSV